MTLDDLRRYAVARSLFTPTTLKRALDRMGFVQADPIRAPARAQDFTLRHRVENYQAGDLERRYARLDVHEDVFVNYGFVTSAVQGLMHPRGGAASSRSAPDRRVRTLMDFVQARGAVHPREVDEHFSHGTVTNYWGGSSRATTHLLDLLHYRGQLRVVRRDAGIRIYAAHEHPTVLRDLATRRAHVDALVDVVVNLYAPLPAASLSMLVRRLRYAVPQWQRELGECSSAGEAAAGARAGRRARLVFPGEGFPGGVPFHRLGAAAGALRSGRVGSPSLRAALGLGLSLRSVHARAQTEIWLLRAAPAVA